MAKGRMTPVTRQSPPVQRTEKQACDHQRGPAQHRQHHRLCQELPYQPQPACSQGDAKCQLPAAICRTRGKQTGQVRAGREQHEQSERTHAIKKSADEVALVGVKSGTDQPQRHSGVGLRIFLRQLGCDRAQIFHRLPGVTPGFSRPMTVKG